MTVKEYNEEFLPKIEHAEEFIRLFESAIRHMDERKVDKNEVRRHFELRCYSEETKKTILTALEYYKEHEGINRKCRLPKLEVCTFLYPCKAAEADLIYIFSNSFA